VDFWDYTCRLFELYLAICWTNLSDYTYTCWAEAPIKIARMTLTIKLDGNWSSFQLANSAPPLSVTDSAIAPSARMWHIGISMSPRLSWSHHCGWPTMMMTLGISSSATSPCNSTLTNPIASWCVSTLMGIWGYICHRVSFLLGPKGPSKIQEVTLMRPIHGNL